MGANMADVAARSIEEAHNKTVNTTDQWKCAERTKGNLRKCKYSEISI